MDIINEDVQEALHTIACERFGLKNQDTKLYVNYDKETICFDSIDSGIHITVNCAADSQSAAVIDFCKAILP